MNEELLGCSLADSRAEGRSNRHIDILPYCDMS